MKYKLFTDRFGKNINHSLPTQHTNNQQIYQQNNQYLSNNRRLQTKYRRSRHSFWPISPQSNRSNLQDSLTSTHSMSNKAPYLSNRKTFLQRQAVQIKDSLN